MAIAVVALWRPADAHLDAAAFLLRFEAGASPPEGLARWGAHAVERRELPWAYGPARLYLPAGEERPPGVVLVHGVHHRGMEEARLVAFAEALASAGLAVMTPGIPELSEYRIDAATIPRFGEATRVLAEHLGRERVGLIGVSFSGGLALMAAARQDVGGRIGLVLSLGGHHDLSRVARFYVGQPIEGPDGRTVTTEPHPYGAAVLIHAHADALFPPGDVERSREILRTLLHDRWQDARAQLGTLSEPARAPMGAVLWPRDAAREAERNRLGTQLLRVLDERPAGLEAASPRGSLAALDVPVFLLHGSDDPVVPAVETRWLALEVPGRALEGVLVTDALRHAEYEREPTLVERWQIVHFMARLLLEARSLE